MSDCFLELIDVYKSYETRSEKIDVLMGVDFCLKKGELVSIIGESGSGKSTLLHIMGAMDIPDRGRVILGGYDVNKLSQKERANLRSRKVGFVFQFHYLLPEFTVLENLKIPQMISGKKENIYEKCEEVLKLIGLLDKRDRKPDELSGGQQQLLALGRAMVNDPDLLLMDEPTGNLDEKTSQRVMAKIFDILKKLNISSVVVTHDMKLAMNTQKIYKLYNGKINLEK